VSRANRKAYGISQEVEVRPSVDFSRLEEVMIVTEQSAAVDAIEATEGLNEAEAGTSVEPAAPESETKDSKKTREKGP